MIKILYNLIILLWLNCSLIHLHLESLSKSPLCITFVNKPNTNLSKPWYNRYCENIVNYVCRTRKLYNQVITRSQHPQTNPINSWTILFYIYNVNIWEKCQYYYIIDSKYHESIIKFSNDKIYEYIIYNIRYQFRQYVIHVLIILYKIIGFFHSLQYFHSIYYIMNSDKIVKVPAWYE